MDTKARELYLLFRAYPGYEASTIKITNKNGKASAPVGFVTFTNRQDADEARRKLQGVRFDPEVSQTIRLELARSNTKVSKPKQPSPPIFPTGMPGGMVNPAAAGGFIPVTDPSILGASMFEHLQALNEQQQLMNALSGVPLLHGGNPAVSAAHFLPQTPNFALAQMQQQQQLLANGMLSMIHANGGGNPPCSTLFVANIGSGPSEEELRCMFKKFPDFSRLRINNKGGAPVAFVEYLDIRQAAMALMNLQGAQLASSERGSGIRIEYARTKMGETASMMPIFPA